jgi:hypothetical protein
MTLTMMVSGRLPLAPQGQQADHPNIQVFDVKTLTLQFAAGARAPLCVGLNVTGACPGLERLRLRARLFDLVAPLVQTISRGSAPINAATCSGFLHHGLPLPSPMHGCVMRIAEMLAHGIITSTTRGSQGVGGTVVHAIEVGSIGKPLLVVDDLINNGVAAMGFEPVKIWKASC